MRQFINRQTPPPFFFGEGKTKSGRGDINQEGIRMNRRIAMVALPLLMVSLVGGSLVLARGAEIVPTRGFHVVTNFQETMYAGSTCETYYRFRNITKQKVPVMVRFIIEGLEIGPGEWSVVVTIDDNEVGCYENEPGVFESSEYLVSPKSWHDLRIGVSSLPNILPSTYALTMELHSTKVKVPQKK